MQTNCILSAPILLPLYACNCESSVYLCIFLSKFCPLRWIPCWLLTNCSDVRSDEFLVPQIDRKSTRVKEQWHEKNYLQSVWGKTAILNTENIQICGWITTLEAIKCNWFAFSSISAEYLQKAEFFISQGSVATWLRWGG